MNWIHYEEPDASNNNRETIIRLILRLLRPPHFSFACSSSELRLLSYTRLISRTNSPPSLSVPVRPYRKQRARARRIIDSIFPVITSSPQLCPSNNHKSLLPHDLAWTLSLSSSCSLLLICPHDTLGGTLGHLRAQGELGMREMIQYWLSRGWKREGQRRVSLCRHGCVAATDARPSVLTFGKPGYY